MSKQPDTDSRPNQDIDTPRNPSPLPRRTVEPEPRGIDRSIADADKVARTGSTDEHVRNTPPFGDFDDTVADERDRRRGREPKS